MRVKICGIKVPEQGKHIVNSGATALGFICVASSPRFVSIEEIRLVAKVIPNSIDIIGVFANTSIENIQDIAINSSLTGVQLHGDESVEFCKTIRKILPNVEIIKALRIRDILDLKNIDIYRNYVDTLLLDAYDPNQLGGTGKTIDLQILKQLEPGIPWFLAGGLAPNNIIEVLSNVKPNGIDLSSGVESSPGDKDSVKVNQLFEQLNMLKIIGDC
jgi:phosphoribosylanthranilate isomerase